MKTVTAQKEKIYLKFIDGISTCSCLRKRFSINSVLQNASCSKTQKTHTKKTETNGKKCQQNRKWYTNRTPLWNITKLQLRTSTRWFVAIRLDAGCMMKMWMFSPFTVVCYQADTSNEGWIYMYRVHPCEQQPYMFLIRQGKG